MPDKIYEKGHWIRDPAYAGFFYMPAGYYDIATIPDKEGWTFVDQEQAHQLVALMDESGMIKPRLDERLREEDLKITHRLLDLLEKAAK